MEYQRTEMEKKLNLFLVLPIPIDFVEMENCIEIVMDTMNDDIDKNVPGQQANGFLLPV